MLSIESKYARLLVDYCLEIKKGDRLYIKSTLLAEPLVREVYREALERGAHVEMDLSFSEMHKIFIENAEDDQLDYVPTLYSKAMESFDTYLAIMAPFNLREDQDLDEAKVKRRSEATKPYQQKYFQRTADGSMRRSLCLYPTQASAQRAEMSLTDYRRFVYNACRLYDDDPAASWRQVRASQQKVVDRLNASKEIAYRGSHIDITFSVNGRTWINSDGRTNMPSGEVFTAPVEDSVNGKVTFTYPSIYMGTEVEEVTLWVRDGYVEKWDARSGKEFLDKIFEMDGTRRFGEAAIGTNYNIQQITGNILFDEKIGGTIHMAIGQSYIQTGGKNQSSVHWDMITDMKKDGEIYADGELIYKQGKFLV